MTGRDRSPDQRVVLIAHRVVTILAEGNHRLGRTDQIGEQQRQRASPCHNSSVDPNDPSAVRSLITAETGEAAAQAPHASLPRVVTLTSWAHNNMPHNYADRARTGVRRCSFGHVHGSLLASRQRNPVPKSPAVRPVMRCSTEEERRANVVDRAQRKTPHTSSSAEVCQCLLVCSSAALPE